MKQLLRLRAGHVASIIGAMIASCSSTLPIRAGIDSDTLFARFDVESGVFVAAASVDAVAWIRDTDSGMTLVSADVAGGHVFLARVRGEKMDATWDLGAPIAQDLLEILRMAATNEELEAAGIIEEGS